jgi:hypothetical protein
VNRKLSKLFVLFLLPVTCVVHADPVFKSTMPDGKILYGNAPVKGAKKVEKMTPNTQDSGVRITTPHQKQDVDQRQSQRQEEGTRRESELDQLKSALKQAEEARESGREPHEGDFIGNARGGMRLNEEYLERQKTLETNVQEARKRLDEAQSR